MKEKDTFDSSMAEIRKGDMVAVFMGTGTKISGIVNHVGADYLAIKRGNYPACNVRIKAVVSWQYQEEYAHG